MKKETPAQLFFYQSFKNFFGIEHLRGTASYVERFLLRFWRHFYKYIYTGAAIFCALQVAIASSSHKNLLKYNIIHKHILFSKVFMKWLTFEYRGWFGQLTVHFLKYQKTRRKIGQKTRDCVKFYAAACFTSYFVSCFPMFQEMENTRPHKILRGREFRFL